MGVTNTLILLLGLLGVSLAFICPESDGHFQHETRCDKYYWCVNHVPHVSFCPPGSFFSTVTNFCNWPYAVSGCSEDGARTDAGWSQPQPEPQSPPSQHQHLNSWEQDSNRWSQQNWDTFMAKALKGAIARSKRETMPKAVPFQGWGVCNGDDGYFRHEEDCTLYWWCVNGVPRIQSCQGGLFYDPNIERCSWAKSVFDCNFDGKRTAAFKSKSSHQLSRHTRSIVKGYQCPNSYGYFRHPTMCNQYVWCIESVPRLMECLGDTRFDIVIKRCNIHWKVPDCDGTNRRLKPDTAPYKHVPQAVSRKRREIVIVQGYQCPNSYGYFRHPTSCSLYVRCVDGVPRQLECEENKYFDEKIKFCNRPWFVDGCEDGGRRTAPERTPLKSLTHHQKVSAERAHSRKRRGIVLVQGYQCPNSYGYFRHPTSCSLYVRCVDGVPRQLECEENKYFDEKIKFCNRPWFVDGCEDGGRRTAPERTPFKSLTHHQKVSAERAHSRKRRGIVLVQGYQCPNSYGYFRHPTSCSLYVRCVDGVPRQLQCEGNKYFDEKIKFCNRPWFVNGCDEGGRRNVPERTPYNHLGVFPPTTADFDDVDEPEISCNPNDDGLWGDPIDCAVYYHCNKGEGTQFRCSPGTFFNPKTLVCSWPGEVSDCNADGTVKDIFVRKRRSVFLTEDVKKERDQSQGMPADVPAPEFYNCGIIDGYYPHDTKCDVYFRCFNGKSTQFRCTPGTFYNPGSRTCTWPRDVYDCDREGNRQPAGREKRSLVNAPAQKSEIDQKHAFFPDQRETYECPDIDGYYRHTTNCSVYFRCTQRKSTRFVCTQGTFYDHKIMACSWPETILDCNRDGSRMMVARKRRSVLSAPGQKDGLIPQMPADVPVPDFYDCPLDDGYYPHDYKCGVYFRCVNGKSTQFGCTPGTFFNPRTSTCTWPQEVIECDMEGNRQPAFRKKRSPFDSRQHRTDIDQKHAFFPDQSETYECPANDGFYRHKTNCAVYFRCLQGKSQRFVCTQGTFYNPGMKSCSWPEAISDCNTDGTRMLGKRKRRSIFSAPGQKDGLIPQMPADVPVPDFYDCPLDDGYYPHDYKCGVYFRCVNGKSTQFGCTPGTFFNPRTSTCTWPQEVIECDMEGNRQPAFRKKRSPSDSRQHRTDIDQKHAFFPDQSETYECPANDGFYRHKTNCAVYFRCLQGKSQRFVCTQGTFYNPSMKSCSWPEAISDCNTDGTRMLGKRKRRSIFSAPGQKDTPPHDGKYFRCPLMDGYYRDAMDCKVYYWCVNRRPTKYACANGTFFNPKMRLCTWPSQVFDCGEDGNRISLSPFQSRVKEFTCPKEDGYYRHPISCATYFRCNERKLTVYKCTPGTVFDPKNNVCSWPAQVPDCNENAEVISAPFKGHSAAKATTKKVEKKKETSTSSNVTETVTTGNVTTEETTYQTTPISTTLSPDTTKQSQTTEQTTKAKGQTTLKAKVMSTVAPKVKKGDKSSTVRVTVKVDNSGKVSNHTKSTRNSTQIPKQPKVNDGFGHSEKTGEPFTFGTLDTTGFKCPQVEGYFSDMDDCASYFHCEHGVAYKRECGPGDFYSPLSQTCIPGDLVPDCNYEDSPEAETYPEWTKDYYKSYVSEFECPGLHGYYADVSDCTSYLECINGNAYARKCNKGTYFDEKKQKCTWEMNTDSCPEVKTGGPVTETIGKLISSEPFVCPRREGYFRDPKTCTMFYECHEGVPKSKACGPDTLFDDTKKKCTWPELVTGCDVYGRVISSDQTVFSSKEPHQMEKNPRGFACPLPSGHFRDPRDCAVFYHCVKSVAYKGKCRGDHVFDLESLKCLDPQLVPGCDIAPKAPLIEKTAGGASAFQCTTDGYVRNKTDCSVYHICKDGVFTRFECKPGTVFSEQKKLCTWPHLVPGCEDMNVQTENNDAESETMTEVSPPAEEPSENDYAILESPVAEQTSSTDYESPESLEAETGAESGSSSDEESTDSSGEENAGDNGNTSDVKTSDEENENSSVEEAESGFTEVTGTSSVEEHECDSDESESGSVEGQESSSTEDTGSSDDEENENSSEEENESSSDDENGSNSEEESENSSEEESETNSTEENQSSSGEESGSNSSQETEVAKSDETGGGEVMGERQSEWEAVGSRSRSNADSGHLLQGEIEFQCPEVFDGFYGDPTYCDMFYRCVKKKKYTFTCPAGTFFDNERFICNFKEKVSGCTASGLKISQSGNDAPIESPAFVPIATPEPMPLCPESDGLFPHPSSCSKFLYCARFTAMVLSCPKDLVYNMDKKTCDYSENVICIRYD